MKKMVKNSKGITLIALIITIIVMLILAGVTINLTLGENGIFTTAQQAAKNYTDAQEQEMAELGEFTNLLNETIDGLGQNASTGIQNPTYDTLASKAKPGDYVEYDGGNGYEGLWQVLYNDDTYGLQIISADTVTDSFTLGGDTEEAAKASYNNAVETLNTECRKYVNTSYATSGRCVGSNPLNPDDAITDTVTLQFTYNGSAESGWKVADTNYETDYNTMKIATNQNDLGIHDIEKKYWIASRNVASNSSNVDFFVRYVRADGVNDSRDFCFITSGGTSNPYSNSYGIRPVITLISDIQTSSGDGSEGNAFKLVAK